MPRDQPHQARDHKCYAYAAACCIALHCVLQCAVASSAVPVYDTAIHHYSGAILLPVHQLWASGEQFCHASAGTLASSSSLPNITRPSITVLARVDGRPGCAQLVQGRPSLWSTQRCPSKSGFVACAISASTALQRASAQVSAEHTDQGPASSERHPGVLRQRQSARPAAPRLLQDQDQVFNNLTLSCAPFMQRMQRAQDSASVSPSAAGSSFSPKLVSPAPVFSVLPQSPDHGDDLVPVISTVGMVHVSVRWSEWVYELNSKYIADHGLANVHAAGLLLALQAGHGSLCSEPGNIMRNALYTEHGVVVASEWGVGQCIAVAAPLYTVSGDVLHIVAWSAQGLAEAHSSSCGPIRRQLAATVTRVPATSWHAIRTLSYAGGSLDSTGTRVMAASSSLLEAGIINTMVAGQQLLTSAAWRRDKACVGLESAAYFGIQEQGKPGPAEPFEALPGVFQAGYAEGDTVSLHASMGMKAFFTTSQLNDAACADLNSTVRVEHAITFLMWNVLDFHVETGVASSTATAGQAAATGDANSNVFGELALLILLVGAGITALLFAIAATLVTLRRVTHEQRGAAVLPYQAYGRNWFSDSNVLDVPVARIRRSETDVARARKRHPIKRSAISSPSRHIAGALKSVHSAAWLRPPRPSLHPPARPAARRSSHVMSADDSFGQLFQALADARQFQASPLSDSLSTMRTPRTEQSLLQEGDPLAGAGGGQARPRPAVPGLAGVRVSFGHAVRFHRPGQQSSDADAMLDTARTV